MSATTSHAIKRAITSLGSAISLRTRLVFLVELLVLPSSILGFHFAAWYVG
jgi:hypothetical protein